MDECDKIGRSCPSNLKCLKKDGSFACGCENTGFIVKGSGEKRTCQGTKSLLCENLYKKLPRGEKGCRTGESTRLLPVWPVFKSGRRRHILVEFAVGSLLSTERVSPCTPVFPSTQKLTLPNSNSIPDVQNFH